MRAKGGAFTTKRTQRGIKVREITPRRAPEVHQDLVIVCVKTFSAPASEAVAKSLLLKAISSARLTM